MLACALQLCLVYGTAGLAKVQGKLWQNGTALYYILRVGEFAWSGYGAAIYEHGVLITLLTYGTVAFQLSFPFLLFAHRRTRRFALVAGMAFHLGIGVILGLLTFSAFLIGVELMFISDQEYQAAQRALRCLWRFLVARGMRQW